MYRTSVRNAASRCGYRSHGSAHLLLGLYDDSRFPGRCLLVFHSHIEDFSLLSPEQSLAFVEDAKKAARAIQAVTNVSRINCAILGNVERHMTRSQLERGEVFREACESPFIGA